MEALVAVSAAALTVYDMLKAIDRAITIEKIRLLRKTGGKSGSLPPRENANPHRDRGLGPGLLPAAALSMVAWRATPSSSRSPSATSGTSSRVTATSFRTVRGAVDLKDDGGKPLATAAAVAAADGSEFFYLRSESGVVKLYDKVALPSAEHATWVLRFPLRLGSHWESWTPAGKVEFRVTSAEASPRRMAR